MITSSSIPQITRMLNDPKSVSDTDLEIIAALKEEFPYFVPARYVDAALQQKKQRYSHSAMTSMQLYMGNWLNFCNYVAAAEVPETLDAPALNARPSIANFRPKHAAASMPHTVAAAQHEETAPADDILEPTALLNNAADEIQQPAAEHRAIPENIAAAETIADEAQEPAPAAQAEDTLPNIDEFETPADHSRYLPPVVKAAMAAPEDAPEDAPEPVTEKDVAAHVKEMDMPAAAQAIETPAPIKEGEKPKPEIIDYTAIHSEDDDLIIRPVNYIVENIDFNKVGITNSQGDNLILPVYTDNYFLHQGIKVSEEIPQEADHAPKNPEPGAAEPKSLLVVMSFSEWLMHFKTKTQQEKEELEDKRALKSMWQQEKLAAAIEEEHEEIPEGGI